MDEELQSKVCSLLMAATGALLNFDVALGIAFATELTDEEREIVMVMGNKYKEVM